MSLSLFLLGGLACFRITSLLVHEAGPYDVFHWLRKQAGIYYDRNSIKIADNEVGRMLLCPWCTSLWVGIGLGILWVILGDSVTYLFAPFAFSAVSIIVQETLDMLKNLDELEKWLAQSIERS